MDRERGRLGRGGLAARAVAVLGVLALMLGAAAVPVAQAVVPAVSAPGDFVIDVSSAVVNPNTGIARLTVSITNNGDTARDATVLLDSVTVYTVNVAAGATGIGLVDAPDCVDYMISVDLGFGSLAFDSPYPPVNCPSKVTISAPPGPSSLTRSVTVVNIVAEQLSFVVFAFAEDGTNITKRPSPGDTSYTLDAGQSVTFTATTQPLPAGQTRFYYLLLPVLGDLEVGRSGLFTVTSPSALKKFSLLAAPKATGIVKRGKKLTAFVGRWSPAATSYRYAWFKNNTKIKAATKSTFKIPRSWKKGTRISVKVTVLRAGYAPAAATSAKRKVK